MVLVTLVKLVNWYFMTCLPIYYCSVIRYFNSCLVFFIFPCFHFFFIFFIFFYFNFCHLFTFASLDTYAYAGFKGKELALVCVVVTE